MEDLLTYILNGISDSEPVDLTREDEEGIIRLNVQIEREDYPKVIGKRGLTIKAITDLIRLYEAKNDSESHNRIYVNASTDE